MARKHLAALPLALTAALAIAAPAMADVRNFPFSYPYETPGQGERELELYTDYNNANELENQLELGYGVTDRLSASLYGVFTNLHTAERKFEELKFEARYRLAEKDELPLDTGLYLEYAQPLAAGEAPELEGKILLEKTLGSLVFDSNLIVEKKLSDEPFEFGATLGGAYALNDDLKLGVESRLHENKFYAGPTASLNLGATRLVGGVYYGGESETQGRLIIGQEF